MRINYHGLLWKMALPVILVFSLSSVCLLFYISSQMQKNTIENAVSTAEDTVDQFKILRKYYSQNIIKKVLGSTELRPAIDHTNDSNAIPLPATMIHDLSALLSEKDTSIKLYSDYPFPNRENRKLDAFQSEAWVFLNQHPDQNFVQQEKVNGHQILRVAIADTMTADVCVSCHNNHPLTPKADWKLGDVRGVLEVSTNVDDALAAGAATNRKIQLMLIATLLVILLSIYLTYRHKVGRRLDSISCALADISEGDGNLSKRLDDKGNDELSGLSSNFNSFADNLQNMVKDVVLSSTKVAGMAQELLSHAAENRERTERQMQETNLVAIAVTEMSTSIQAVAHNADTADQFAQQADLAVDNGQSDVEISVSAINALAMEINNSAQTLKALESYSEGIGSVLDVIKSIAEQTNLLALNAAIEAARAGEHGRGFAVVADEVRTLAGRTRQSTEEIETMIERLQNSAIQAVETMNQGQVKATVSVDQTAKTSQSMIQIKQAVSNISQLNSQIASVVEEQSTTAIEISKSIESVRTSANQEKEMGIQTAVTSKQLATLAEELEGIVSKFQLD